MAAVVLTGQVSMPIAMLASGRVAGMEFSMLPVGVAMKFAMPGTPAVAVPAAMLCPMIARLLAMIYAMLAPSRIGRVQFAMIPAGIAMIGPMAAAGRIVIVARRSGSHLTIDLLHLALDSFGGLGTHNFDTLGSFDTLRSARFIARLARISLAAIMLSEISILRHRGQRHAGRQHDTQ